MIMEAKEKLATYQRQATNLGGTNVLIVDDDIWLLRLAKAVIGSIDLSVVTTSSAAEGLKMIAEGYTPDLVLLDIRMPIMNGFEAFDRLRAIARLDNIKIIALTAYASEWDRDRILKYGFDGYISKPFKKANFIDSVRQALAVTVATG